MKKKINIGYLFFVLPLFFFLFINFSRETDIWFLLSHGKYVLSNGFPHTEFLTIHSGFHFVMQQWGFSVLIYLIYKYTGSIGVICFIGIINILIIFFLYKLCIKISNNIYFSCLVASMIDLLLELNFIIPRPQIISLLLIIVTIYILERKDKSVLLLPLLSLLLINIHASMWPMLFIVSLPYIVQYILMKDKSIVFLIPSIVVSVIVGFINPYGIEAMTYSFSSYGISNINKLVGEMHSFSLIGPSYVVYNSVLFLIVFLLLIIFIIKRKKYYSIHSILLILGLSLMAFLNLRNISLFLIGALPFSVLFFTKKIESKIPRYIYLILLLVLVSIFVFRINNNKYLLEDKHMSVVVDYLDSNCNDKNQVILFNYFDDGPYLEYHGYKGYIDTRAEVFIKKNNHKYDVLDEYYNVLKGNIDYDKFTNKYNFTYLIVFKDSNIYKYLRENVNYESVYKNDEIIIFKKLD